MADSGTKIDWEVSSKVLAIRPYRVMIFVDDANFRGDARAFAKATGQDDHWLDRSGDVEAYLKLREYLANRDDGREIVDMVVYLGLPPVRPIAEMPKEWLQIRERKLGFKGAMEGRGMLVFTWDGKDRRDDFDANIDTVMAIDAMQFSLTVRPDIVVLVTGDQDFAHMAQVLRRQGIRVEVAAYRNVGRHLRRSVHEMWDLTEFFGTLRKP